MSFIKKNFICKKKIWNCHKGKSKISYEKYKKHNHLYVGTFALASF